MKQPWTKKHRLFTDICGRNLIQEPEEKPSEMVWSWDSVCQKLDTFSVFDLFHTWCSTTPFLSIILQYRSICHEYPWILWDCLGHSSWFYTMMWQLCVWVCVWRISGFAHDLLICVHMRKFCTVRPSSPWRAESHVSHSKAIDGWC